jgi:hypothetical protein
LADVDGDGLLDLVTGSDNCCDKGPGLYWFRREADIGFSARPKIRVRVPGGDRTYMTRLRATLTDWDGDGRLDVVASLTGMAPALFVSTGPWSPDREVLTPQVLRGGPEHVVTQPCLVDWDRDGRLDLIDATYREGSGWGLAWYREFGTAGAELWTSGIRLASLSAGERPTGLSVCDWDGGGWPDLIVGLVLGEYDPTGSYLIRSLCLRVYTRRQDGVAQAGMDARTP